MKFLLMFILAFSMFSVFAEQVDGENCAAVNDNQEKTVAPVVVEEVVPDDVQQD